jgi:hypothetical protein
VQVTSTANVSARLAKAKALPALASWLQAGGAFEVHGWARVGSRWQARRVAVTGEDLAAEVVEAPARRRRGTRGHRQRGLFDAAEVK